MGKIITIYHEVAGSFVNLSIHIILSLVLVKLKKTIRKYTNDKP